MPSAGGGTTDDNPNPDSFTDSGYYEFPNGLILQWGIIYPLTIDPSMHNTQGFCIPYSFHKSFPHKCISVAVSDYLPDASSSVLSNCATGVKAWTSNTFIPYIDAYTSSTKPLGCSWIAFGY